MEIQTIIDAYRSAGNRLILLDYDGTLANFESTPERAVPGDRLMALLRKLIVAPNTRVVIVTGRTQNSIEEFLGHLPLEIVSDHGAMIKDGLRWGTRLTLSTEWKSTIRKIMRRTVASCPGSFVELKANSLVWHYRNAEVNIGNSMAQKLSEELLPHLQATDLKLMTGNKVIEVMPTAMGKGSVVEELLTHENVDYVLCIGDDISDEEIFSILSQSAIAYTVKVGSGFTAAKYRLNGITEVHALLEQIAE